MSRPAAQYQVGYGKPPVKTRFKKGAPSPNPKGRPKKQDSLFSMLQECLQEEVEVTNADGRRSKLPANKVIAKKIVNQAAQGNHQAQRLLLSSDRRQMGAAVTEQSDDSEDAGAAKAQALAETMSALKEFEAAKRAGHFDHIEKGQMVPATQSAPLCDFWDELLHGRIRSAEEFRRRKNALLDGMEQEMIEVAYKKLAAWQHGLQKSDLE